LNEQKSKWIAKGDKREDTFRDFIAPQLGMQLVDGVKYGVDFYDAADNDRPVELKYRDKPFYMAQKLLNMPPQYTVPINCSNLKRYPPHTRIIFWVDWKKGERFGVGVAATRGLWSIYAGDIDETDMQRHHFYAARSTSESKCGDRDAYGNNVCARYLDLRDLTRIDKPDMVWK
jgi:hypothetical protein